MAASESPRARRRGAFPWRKILLGLLGFMALSAVGCASLFVCLPAWLRWGMAVDTCPAGRPVATGWVEAPGLRRGVWRDLRVGVTAHYTPGDASQDWTVAMRPGGEVEVALLHPDGTETELEARDGWERSWGRARSGEVMLPAELPDGDYALRVRMDSRLGRVETQAELPLYAPARVHLLTDRPLYEPGNDVLFRAVALRAADLVPLAERPGTWIVTDPAGQVLLEEHASTDAWGVVAGSFPLDREAESGTWTVTWRSGEDEGSTSVRVEPFTLPRFSVAAAADLPWYRAGQAPVLRGTVTYSSGAPVARAEVALRWSSAGAWPLPTEWTDGSPGGLPTRAVTDARGRFELELPAVPADLQGQATLLAGLDVTDPAGDRVTGAASVLLSQDALSVSAVTEFSAVDPSSAGGDGLVEGFNNRVYLRATTPDGRPLREADLQVRRAWDRTDPGVSARTDVDGVASLQLDPGPAVNVVVPAVPVRPPPRTPPARIVGVQEALVGRAASLADQRALDEAVPALEACAHLAEGRQQRTVNLRVDPDGRALAFTTAQAVDRCLGRALEARRLPAGGDRLYEIGVVVDDSDLPGLQATVQAWPEADDAVRTRLVEAAAEARSCLPEDTASNTLRRTLEWRRLSGSTALQLRWLGDAGRELPASAMACVERSIERSLAASLPMHQGPATLGILRLHTHASARRAIAQAQPTTMLGYELAVAARGAGGEDLGDTVLRMSPGLVPEVRLRATPILPAPGETVTVEILRGPDFRGELPEKLQLRHQGGKLISAEVDEDSRTVAFPLPADAQGWYSVQWYGAEARVFVRPEGELQVRVRPDAETYAPGQTARLQVQTLQGGAGAPAAVGLFGVDESLGQLAPLPGPGALESVRDPVESARPAFDSLDGQALTLGRIQGAHAAAATVLRVSRVPDPADTDRDVQVYHQATFDPVERLGDRFYVALAALHQATRAWEAEAPPGTLMDNETMAGLWEEALDACDERGEEITDAYGRPLRLHWLPQELLALTDPRAVVIDGTRLPEDVDPWMPWVWEEQP